MLPAKLTNRKSGILSEKKVIGCATDRLSFCIIITGKEHYVISLENLSSSGTFWARVHRTKEEEKSFVSAMTRMG